MKGASHGSRGRKRVAIMQPYLFPYLGYMQLVSSVDRFVFLDDVSYIRGGWINRNRLEFQGETRFFTVPVSVSGLGTLIRDVNVAPGDRWRRKMLASIQQSYGGAPYYLETLQVIEECLGTESSISLMASRSIEIVSRYLGIETTFASSSDRYGNESLRGQDRVLDICAEEQATSYHNLPGGRALYSAERFAERGIALEFTRSPLSAYDRGGKDFVPDLSVLDLLMYNHPRAAAEIVGAPHD